MASPEFYIFNNRAYMDFYPIQFGHEDCDPLHYFGPTLFKHYIFHYVISGKGKLYLTGKNKHYDIEAGQGFLISPTLMCSYEADEKDPWYYMWIEFDGIKAQYFLEQAGLSKNNCVFSQHKSATDSPIYEHLSNLIKHHDKRSSYIIAQSYLFINALIEESLSHRKSNHEDIKEFYIREALNFMEQNYNKRITIADIALHCNLNRHYFSRLFKEKMSCTPQAFLMQYRLSKACELLRHSSMTLEEIAEHIGYSNQFNFSTAFKRHYGRSPHQWRQFHKRV